MIVYTVCLQDCCNACGNYKIPGHLCDVKSFTSVDALKLYIFNEIESWEFHMTEEFECGLIKINIDECIKRLCNNESTNETYEPHVEFDHYISIFKSELN